MSNDIDKKVLDFINALSDDHDLLKFAYNTKKFKPGVTPVYYSGPVWDNEEVAAAISTMLTGRWLSSGENVLKFEDQHGEIKDLDPSKGVPINFGGPAAQA